MGRTPIEKGDVLMSTVGSYGHPAVVTDDRKFAFQRHIAQLKPNSELLDSRFLHTALLSADVQEQIEVLVLGVAQKTLNLSAIKQIRIPVPAIAEQKKFILFIQQADKSEQCEAVTSQVHRINESQFIEMFGDPITNSKGLPIKLLSEVATSRLGKMLDAKQQTGLHRYPYLANCNVQWFRLELGALNKMDFDEADRIEFSMNNGDLLVCEGGEVGRCAIWHDELHSCFFQKAVHRVRCNNMLVLPEYLMWWFKIHSDYDAFEDVVGSKSTIAHLPGVKLKGLEIPMPDIESQQRFVRFLEQADKSKFVCANQGLLIEKQIRRGQHVYRSGF